ncbi:MAG TPA: zf-HC2 domain-containing protein [Pyrinomonadaceae bacterium]|jgi:anti-sigma factor RsiW
MSATATAQEKICEQNLIGAYVDGELDADLTLRLEEHLKDCSDCQFELRAHRLFVCELDASLTNKNRDLPVPADFSRRVAARARSDMSGVRTRAENRKALAICMILALSGLALLGATTRYAVFVVVGRFVTKVFSLVEFVTTTVYDAVVGLIVVLKVLSGKIQSGSSGPLLVLLAVAVMVLSRLLSHYHRTGATE